MRIKRQTWLFFFCKVHAYVDMMGACSASMKMLRCKWSEKTATNDNPPHPRARPPLPRLWSPVCARVCSTGGASYFWGQEFAAQLMSRAGF